VSPASRKVVLYAAASLDNFIATADGGVKWLEHPRFALPREDFGYRKFLRSIDTTLMGHTTYRQLLGFGGPFPYAGKANYVFTRSSRRKDTEHVSFISRNIPAFVRALKKKKGKDLWLVGGARINTLLLNHGLIDRIILTVVPLALGSGIPLFAEGAKPAAFRLKKTRLFPNGFVQITWEGRQEV
jgi:dihydrofolate reductase